MAVEIFTQEEIDRALKTKISLPAYTGINVIGNKKEFPAESDRAIGDNVEHVVTNVQYSLMYGANDLVVPSFRHPGGYTEYEHSIVKPYRGLCAWFDPRFREGMKGMPSKPYVKQILSNVYRAMNPENSHGNYVRAYMNEISKAFGLGPLEEKWQDRHFETPVKGEGRYI